MTTTTKTPELINEANEILARLLARAGVRTARECIALPEFDDIQRKAIDGDDREFFARYYAATKAAEAWIVESGIASMDDRIQGIATAYCEGLKFGKAVDRSEKNEALRIANESMAIRWYLQRRKVVLQLIDA
jgi:hypothetical protein